MTDWELKKALEELQATLKDISTNIGILCLLMFVLVILKGCK